MTRLSHLCTLLFVVVLVGTVLHPAQAQDAPFITIWDTENAGSSDSDQIIISGQGSNYTVEWEEVGNTSNSGNETVASGDTTLTFPSPSVYRIRISGGFTRIDLEEDPEKIVQVKQWGDIEWSTMVSAFQNAKNLDIEADDAPDLSNVKSMNSMFENASSLTATNSNIDSWDVSSVVNMKEVFRDAEEFNGDIDSWNVSNVVSMESMFEGCDVFDQYIGSWDVSKVESMDGMFLSASSFNQDIKSWDLSSLITATRMFYYASNFSQDISSWDVSNVRDMEGMFRRSDSFNEDISSWDVSEVRDMGGMFYLNDAFNQDIGSWDVSGVENMSEMFQGASSFNQSIGSWNISNVSNISDIFSGSALSNKNYDRTLIGWAQRDLQEDIFFQANGIRYCNSGPFRSHLGEAFNWDLRDDGVKDGCPEVLAASGSQQVSADDTYAFSNVAISLTFSDVINGGQMTVARYSDAPRNIDQGTPKSVRFIVAGGGITFFNGITLRFPVGELGGIDQPENITLYSRSQPGQGSFNSLETSVDDNGTPDDISDDTLSVSTNGFGEIAFANDDTPIPVELTSFDGAVAGGSPRLTWQTASETNNAGFEVQRQKKNGWEQVGYVDSKAQGGTTTETQSYNFAAEDLPVGTHQFRLKQVDLDGSSTLIDPVTVDIQMQEALKLTAPAPNPASTSANLSFAVREQSETTIRLYNTLGQQVAIVYAGTPQAGEQQTTQVDVSGLSSGTYFLRMDADGKTQTQRLTVVR